MGRGYKVLRINDLQGIASILPFTEPFQNVSNHFKIESSKIQSTSRRTTPAMAVSVYRTGVTRKCRRSEGRALHVAFVAARSAPVVEGVGIVRLEPSQCGTVITFPPALRRYETSASSPHCRGTRRHWGPGY